MLPTLDEDDVRIRIIASWWFQPLSKILVRLYHFPADRGKNNRIFETTTQIAETVKLPFLMHSASMKTWTSFIFPTISRKPLQFLSSRDLKNSAQKSTFRANGDGNCLFNKGPCKFISNIHSRSVFGKFSWKVLSIP